MSSAATAQPEQTPYEPSPLAAFLSYLIPGLGQIYQGRLGKGFLFMVSLLGMFYLGQAMGQWQNVYVPRTDRERPEHGGRIPDLPASLVVRWHFVGQFWIGISAWPALIHYARGYDPHKDPKTFWDIYQQTPNETELNAFLVNSDKTPDLGWVYTVIAGMLNVLVIYDAYAGPMLSSSRRPAQRNSLAPVAEAKAEGAT